MELGKKIAECRKGKNMTQDALAKELGISNQAVSKWENEQSLPDIELLPKLAECFGITMDELFGRTETKREDMIVETCAMEHENVGAVYTSLPWEDDGKLRAVLFKGQKLVQKNDLSGMEKICEKIVLNHEGPAVNIESCFSVICGDVGGNISAGSYVECDNVEGNIAAGSHVECEGIAGNVSCGSYVECEGIAGDVSTGGHVECEGIAGNVSCGSYVCCGEVAGDISADGYVECSEVGGDVTAESFVNCGDVGGDVNCQGNVTCGNVDGDIEARGTVYCKAEE